MQRNLASMAVEEGTMSAEDAERFTALHDLLIEEGLMAIAEGGGMGGDGYMGQHSGMGGGMGQGMGNNEDLMHQRMLDAGIERGLITEDDKAFFLTAHDAIEAYRPKNGVGKQLDDAAKAAMQRNLASMAVEEGTMSAEDAERFTALHDLLIEEGLMGIAEGMTEDDA
jgi:polyhydroxyalkanoate synthesis regulator phasin